MKKKKIRIKKSIPTALAISIISGCIFAIFCVFICAYVLTMYDIEPSMRFFLWYVVAGISGLVIGVTAGKLSLSKSIVWSTLSAMIVAGINILVLLIASDFNFRLEILFLIPAYIITGAVSSVVTSNLRK